MRLSLFVCFFLFFGLLVFAFLSGGPCSQLVRDGIHANLRQAFLNLEETQRAAAELAARSALARRFARDQAQGVADALQSVIGAAVVRVLRTFTSPTGGNGKAKLRSKAPSLRRLGRAIAFTLNGPARAALDAVLHTEAVVEVLQSAGMNDAVKVVGGGVFQNEAVGTMLAFMLVNMGVVRVVDGWMTLAPEEEE